MQSLGLATASFRSNIPSQAKAQWDFDSIRVTLYHQKTSEDIREISQAVSERRGRPAQVLHPRLNAVERVAPFFKHDQERWLRCGISIRWKSCRMRIVSPPGVAQSSGNLTFTVTAPPVTGDRVQSRARDSQFSEWHQRYASLHEGRRFYRRYLCLYIG